VICIGEHINQRLKEMEILILILILIAMEIVVEKGDINILNDFTLIYVDNG
jgi:hypothetical protein